MTDFCILLIVSLLSQHKYRYAQCCAAVVVSKPHVVIKCQFGTVSKPVTSISPLVIGQCAEQVLIVCCTAVVI